MDWLGSKLVVANWKMNGTIEKARDFITHLDSFYSNSRIDRPCIICPPYTLLHFFHKNITKQGTILLGGQHCSPNDSGAYTGDISAAMLADVGCKFVIIAHSERRNYFKESYRIAKHQCIQALKYGLTPILCIGEENREDAEMAISAQLEEAAIGSLAGEVILAYEPIWAIGGKAEPDVEHMIRVMQVIRETLPLATVLYGGSVKADNVKPIIRISDGVMIGGASLDYSDFCKILNICLVAEGSTS